MFESTRTLFALSPPLDRAKVALRLTQDTHDAQHVPVETPPDVGRRSLRGRLPVNLACLTIRNGERGSTVHHGCRGSSRPPLRYQCRGCRARPCWWLSGLRQGMLLMPGRASSLNAKRMRAAQTPSFCDAGRGWGPSGCGVHIRICTTMPLCPRFHSPVHMHSKENGTMRETEVQEKGSVLLLSFTEGCTPRRHHT